MWKYNQTPEPDELYHHGIKGQQWGKRRFQNKDGTLTPAGKKRYNTEARTDLDEKKAAYKAANKAYNKSFNKAYDKAIAAYSPSKKHRQANEERWKDVADKADTLRKAQSEYKSSKKSYKESRDQAMKKAVSRAQHQVNFRDAAYMERARSKGKTYASNITAGVLGGAMVASAVNHQNGRDGKQAVQNLLFGAGLGAVSGTVTATTQVIKGNMIANKKYRVD